jgi:hypothetical protein
LKSGSHLFSDQRWWDFCQHLLAGGDRDGAVRLFAKRSGVDRRPLVEAHYGAVRVASFGLVLPFMEQVQRRQNLSLSALQQRYRVPPRLCRASPLQLSPKTCWPPLSTSPPLRRTEAIEATLPMLLKQFKLARFRSHWHPQGEQPKAVCPA